jgi:hypothetical protein
VDREQEALRRAEKLVDKLPSDLKSIRKASAQLVRAEAGLVREALVLQTAATGLVVPASSHPVRSRAVLALASLQRELLGQGREAVLGGRYAAAVQLARMIDELNDGQLHRPWYTASPLVPQAPASRRG